MTDMQKVFKNQQWVALALIVLGGGTSLWVSQNRGLFTGNLWNISALVWFWIALAIPVVHQLYVWWVWRFELYYYSFSKRLGWQKAFKIYKTGFSILFGGRLVTIILLALATQKILTLFPLVSYALVAGISPLAAYLFYSVHRYFSMDRAYGIDHFDRDYSEPFEKKGIFRFTSNGMYVIGMMVLYLPGLLLFSMPALVVALFNHLYIWVHYYATERPDMNHIYGDAP